MVREADMKGTKSYMIVEMKLRARMTRHLLIKSLFSKDKVNWVKSFVCWGKAIKENSGTKYFNEVSTLLNVVNRK